MAEGGPSPESSPVDNTQPNSLDSYLLDCPICLEQLREPKCLPCRHSFCEECLSSNIVKKVSGTSDTTSSFTCPVCRTLTYPVNKYEDKKNWAKQFPTDSTAVEIIQLVNHTAEPYYCKPCQKKKNRTTAQFWCKATQCLYCESCKIDFHDLFHTECDTVDIRNLLDELMTKFSTTKIQHEFQSNVSNISACMSLGRGRKMKVFRKTCIKCPSDTKDCCILGVVNLPDGRIIVSDLSNRKLKLIGCEGNVVNELKINGKPRGLYLVDNTTVAASTESPGGISVVTVAPSSLSLSAEIYTGKSCYGVAYRNDEFVVSTGYEVCSVSKDGTTHKVHGYGDMVLGMSYDSKHGQLFITHNTGTLGRAVVSRLSGDNNNTDVSEVGVVKHAFGVDVDEEGNGYVCGYGSNNVVQMSGDGTNIRELLTEADGINQPRAISVCGDKIVVTNDSSEQMNYITLFQLV